MKFTDLLQYTAAEHAPVPFKQGDLVCQTEGSSIAAVVSVSSDHGMYSMHVCGIPDGPINIPSPYFYNTRGAYPQQQPYPPEGNRKIVTWLVPCSGWRHATDVEVQRYNERMESVIAPRIHLGSEVATAAADAEGFPIEAWVELWALAAFEKEAVKLAKKELRNWKGGESLTSGSVKLTPDDHLVMAAVFQVADTGQDQVTSHAFIGNTAGEVELLPNVKRVVVVSVCKHRRWKIERFQF